MNHYKSDITQFLEQLKQSNPHIERDQLYGRSLLWDLPPRTPEDLRREGLARVPKPAYEYFSFRSK